MRNQWSLLVAYAHLEEKRTLIPILDSLSVGVISASSLKQTGEALSQHKIDLVFCDDELPDGSFCDLSLDKRPAQKLPRMVIMTHVGQWEDSLRATGLGALGVLGYPLRPTASELLVHRAMHEDQKEAFRMTA